MIRDRIVIEALSYKLEGHGFETLPVELSPGVYSASDRNSVPEAEKL
jgi:hypothetical protein